MTHRVQGATPWIKVGTVKSSVSPIRGRLERKKGIDERRWVKPIREESRTFRAPTLLALSAQSPGGRDELRDAGRGPRKIGVAAVRASLPQGPKPGPDPPAYPVRRDGHSLRSTSDLGVSPSSGSGLAESPHPPRRVPVPEISLAGAGPAAALGSRFPPRRPLAPVRGPCCSWTAGLTPVDSLERLVPPLRRSLPPPSRHGRRSVP